MNVFERCLHSMLLPLKAVLVRFKMAPVQTL